MGEGREGEGKRDGREWEGERGGEEREYICVM